MRTAAEMERALSGKAVNAGDGLLHIERTTGETLCGEPVEAYPLHWDTTTVVVCGICLMEAGVPLRAGGSGTASCDAAQPGRQRRLPESNRWKVPESRDREVLAMRCVAWVNRAGFRRLCPNEAALEYGGQGFCVHHAERIRADVLAGGRVYFAERDGLVKIGVSQDPESRVAALGARLLATESGGRTRERELHLRFAEARVEGEWFEPTDEILGHIHWLTDQWFEFSRPPLVTPEGAA